MNQRIRELAHRADLVIKKSNGNDFRFGAMDPNLEKFAELIVRECAKSANYWYQNHDKIHSDPMSYVLAHFGVEE
jgi:hypothetical protein